MVPSPNPYDIPFLDIGVCNLATPLISGTGKATDFKFGAYIYMANSIKSPLKILEKMERGRIQRLPNFLGTPYYLGPFSGSGKAADYKFGGYIYRVSLNKSLLKILEKRERGRIQRLSKFFSGTPYYLRNG